GLWVSLSTRIEGAVDLVFTLTRFGSYLVNDADALSSRVFELRVILPSISSTRSGSHIWPSVNFPLRMTCRISFSGKVRASPVSHTRVNVRAFSKIETSFKSATFFQR